MIFAWIKKSVTSFVLVIILLSATIGLLASPLALLFGSMNLGPWSVSSPEASLLIFCLGLLAGVLSLHAFNGLAFVWRALSGWALKGPDGPPPAPAGPAPEPLPERTGPIIIP